MKIALVVIGVLLSVVQAEVEIRVAGNEAFTAARLLSEVDAWVEDVRDDPADDGALDDLVYELQRFHVVQGFPSAEASWKRTREAKRWIITVEIRQGPRRLVGEVTLEGTQALDAGRLRAAIPWKRAGLLGSGRRVFSRDDLDAGLAGIRLLYRLEGFNDVEAAAAVTERVDGDTIAVDIAITVREGERHTLAELRVRGTERYPVSDLLAAARVEPGSAYTPRLPLEIARRVRRWLAERGHFGARVEATSADGPDPTSRIVILEVAEEPVAAFGSIVVAGNERTAERWLRRRLRFHDGDVYRQSALEESRRALLETGLFKNVTIEAVCDAADPELLDVTVRVEEKDALRFGLRVGFGAYELGRLGADVVHRNLLGRGWEGRLRGRLSFRGEEAEVSLRYPFLFEQRLALRLRTQYVRFEEVSFGRQELTSTVALEAPVTTDWLGTLRLTTGYEISDEQIHDPDVLVPPELTEDTRSAELFFAGTRDTRDSILSPTRGSRVRARVDYADHAFGSELDFVRLTGAITRVFGITEESQVIASARAGWIRPLESSEIPLTERFFLGGARSVRSFPQDELGPQDAGDNPIGGEAFVVANLELRVPLWRSLKGAIFYDTGSLVLDDEDFARKDYRHGAGLGLFLETPVGPLRVDAAANLDRERGEDSWALHVLFGHPF